MDDLKNRVEASMKKNKIACPITREGFSKLCKDLYVPCTTLQVIEALLFCRGKQLEEEPPETFSMQKMLVYI